ncbi:hypothetical protein [Bacillus benzoevorans]|uniref:Uncharacterized protein n=1 Tax=Bacillus benzoevorans TaxID=1456 RepID=A0A7X0HRP7_9BACI|nr:hypothetical protein [Bacillus benzoevorans]MBB6444321.1 hypothetical protein [Bacillus benzoevorans]
MVKRLAEEILHMPDLQFTKYCEEQFAINKGVYNTIDLWFYQQGISSIINRRGTILLFCQSMAEAGNKKVKFGHGGLTAKLLLFWQQYRQSFEHKAI